MSGQAQIGTVPIKRPKRGVRGFATVNRIVEVAEIGQLETGRYGQLEFCLGMNHSEPFATSVYPAAICRRQPRRNRHFTVCWVCQLALFNHDWADIYISQSALRSPFRHPPDPRSMRNECLAKPSRCRRP